MKKYWPWVLAAILLLVAIDLILKNAFDGQVLKFLSPFVSIEGNTHNTGGAFSLFWDNVVVLACISTVFIGAFIWYSLWEKQSNTLKWIAFTLIISGALGNLIDRVFLGYVRDFLKFDFINFPIFNFADMCLTFGLIFFAINTLFILGKKEKQTNAK